MRVLVAAPRLPEFDREGGSRRIFLLLEILQELGWSVSYLAHDATNGDRYIRLLRQRGIATYAGRDSFEVRSEYLPDPDGLFRDARFDLAIFAFWNLAEYYIPILRQISPGTRAIVDSIDLHFLRQARSLLQPLTLSAAEPKLDLRFASEMMREMNVYAAADAVLTVSQKEADLINDFTSNPQLAWCVPNGDDLERSTIPAEQRHGILFVGNFRHPPNREAVEFLLNAIYPRLQSGVVERHPIQIVGNELPEGVRQLAERLPGVHAVGWVPSVLPYLERARMTVVPVLHGAGTKSKLVQALLIGTPSVSTTLGAEGIGISDDNEVLLADEPGTFAEAVARLADDDVLWNRLASEGRTRTLATHGKDTVREHLSRVIDRLMAVSR